MKQSCFSMRPGTLIYYKDRKWRVTDNDTLNRIFTMETIDKKPHWPHLRKKFNYSPGQEVSVMWVPQDNRR